VASSIPFDLSAISRSIAFNDRDLLEGASDSLLIASKRARIIAITAIDNDNRIEARESETVNSRFGDSQFVILLAER